MDSLIANYASSSDEEDDRRQQKSPIKPRGSLFASLPAPKQRPVPAFPSLPPPKIQSFSLEEPQGDEPDENGARRSSVGDKTEKPRKSLFSSLPPPKIHTVTSTFSLPPPKNKSAAATAGSKRVVEFKPPVNRALLEIQDDDDEPVAKKRATSERKAVAGGLTAILPPPKHSSGSGTALGGGSAGGHMGRRSVIETDEQSPDSARELSPASSVDQSFFNNPASTAEQAGGVDYGTYHPGDYSTDRSQGGLMSDGAAWSHGNYYEANPQYPGNWSDQANSNSWNGGSAQTAQQSPEGVGSNAINYERKRGRNEITSNIIEVKQDELMNNRPRQDQAKLTGIAFGPSYQPVSNKDKPSKLHKKKHQIGSLYFDLKQREMELAERRARGQLTKAETQAKYGW